MRRGHRRAQAIGPVGASLDPAEAESAPRRPPAQPRARRRHGAGPAAGPAADVAPEDTGRSTEGSDLDFRFTSPFSVTVQYFWPNLMTAEQISCCGLGPCVSCEHVNPAV